MAKRTHRTSLGTLQKRRQNTRRQGYEAGLQGEAINPFTSHPQRRGQMLAAWWDDGYMRARSGRGLDDD